MSRVIQVGDRAIGAGQPAFIIAEIGINHNGDVSLAKEMIQAAAEAGADAVKFQTFKTENFLSKRFFDFEERKKYELAPGDYEVLWQCAKDCGVEFFSTPLDEESLVLLNDLGVNLFKIASSDLTNIPLLKKVAALGKPVIFSTGYSQVSEIYKAYETLLAGGANEVMILHCVASYPTQDEDVNLKNINLLKNLFPTCLIGFSDHSLDFELLPPVAVGLGACVIEKHFTLDQGLPGYDHGMSLTPAMMKKLVQNVRRVEVAMGQSRLATGVISSELQRKGNARRSLYWMKDVKKGEVITAEHVISKRPGKGIAPEHYDTILGLTLLQDVEGDSLVEMAHVG